jgi:hypothetical protein
MTRLSSSPLAFRIALLASVAGAAGTLDACSSSAPPVLTSNDGTDGGGGEISDATAGRDGSVSSVETDAATDGSSAAGEASTSIDSGGTEVPDVGYTLIDVAALPDAAGLDGNVPCGLLSCSPGCCTSEGTCLPGTDPTACGTEGNACVDCTQTQQTCDPTTWRCEDLDDAGDAG